MSAYSLMSDDYLITTAYARESLTDLETELLKRLERVVDAARGVEPAPRQIEARQKPDWCQEPDWRVDFRL